MNKSIQISLLTLASLAVLASVSLASSPASDNASNYNTSTWTSANNFGTGFGPWSFNQSGGTAGSYVGGSGDGANTFALFANAGENSSADRAFTGALLAGQTFSMDLGSTANVGAGAQIGLRLLNSSSTPAFSFLFTGGQSFWQLNDGGSNFNTTIPFAANTPILFAFTYNGGSNYSVNISEGATVYTANNTASNDISTLSGVRAFNNGQGTNENLGFNNLAIVPEPSSLALLGGTAVLSALMFLRRRRA